MTTKVTSLVLANTAVTVGNYGGTTQHAVVKVDGQGRITYAANATPSIATTQLTGTITNSQLAGSITADKITSLATTQLTGTITNSQLAGSITADKITSLATTQLTGTITNSQLAGSISNDKLAGSITADKITSLATTQLTGTITNAQLAVGAIQAAYPVGSIYMNATNATNPATLLGFGIWTAFGAGRMLVGFDSGNTLFDTAEETGGSADAIAVSHTHTYSGTTGNDSPDHTHLSNAVGLVNGTINWVGTGGTPYNNGNNTQTGGASTNHTHTYSGTTASTGSSGTNANIPPYITVFMWKRTA